MATDKKTLEALDRITQRMKVLGVKGVKPEDLKTLNRDIGQQKRQPAWDDDGYAPKRR
jgi:hypothetical protein